MEVSSPPPPANGVALASAPSLDPTQLVDHLVAVIVSNLGATRQELEGAGCLLHPSRLNDTTQRCVRFASDSQPFLYVQKDIAPSSTAESPSEEPSMRSSLSPRPFEQG
jgi:dynein heavy chain 1